MRRENLGSVARAGGSGAGRASARPEFWVFSTALGSLLLLSYCLLRDILSIGASGSCDGSTSWESDLRAFHPQNACVSFTSSSDSSTKREITIPRSASVSFGKQVSFPQICEEDTQT